MASEHPLTIDQVIRLFDKEAPGRQEVRAALEEISADCAERGYELKQVASGYRFQVKVEYSDWVSRLWKEKPPRYSRALLETLALIAYKQPITRGDIEEVRGVSVSTNIMRTLLERDWVKVVGHRDVPGHPALYATTRNFLDYFNLRSLEELPSLSEIRDLNSGTEELDSEEELIEIPTLNIDIKDKLEVTGLADADLDEVSQQVTNIQENISTFLRTESEKRDEIRELDESITEMQGNITPIKRAKAPAENSED